MIIPRHVTGHAMLAHPYSNSTPKKWPDTGHMQPGSQQQKARGATLLGPPFHNTPAYLA